MQRLKWAAFSVPPRSRLRGRQTSPFRGEGSSRGSALLTHAEGRIRSAGHASVWLDARSNAEAFYLGRGYQRRGARSADDSQPMSKMLGGTAMPDVTIVYFEGRARVEPIRLILEELAIPYDDQRVAGEAWVEM